MTKSELIEQIAMRQPELSLKDVEAAVRIILDDVTDALAHVVASRFAVSAASRCTIVSHDWGATPRPVSRWTWMASSSPTSSPARSCASRSMPVAPWGIDDSATDDSAKDDGAAD